MYAECPVLERGLDVTECEQLKAGAVYHISPDRILSLGHSHSTETGGYQKKRERK